MVQQTSMCKLYGMWVSTSTKQPAKNKGSLQRRRKFRAAMFDEPLHFCCCSLTVKVKDVTVTVEHQEGVCEFIVSLNIPYNM